MTVNRTICSFTDRVDGTSMFSTNTDIKEMIGVANKKAARMLPNWIKCMTGTYILE